ncbi:MAG: hypothetical protein H0X31_01310 [Nostocaceae cyanobacterium]|nr:hypothetical protein [Nostocaceae cyanobacterium]
MSSPKFSSDETSQTSKMQRDLTAEKKAALRARVDALPSPEEMKQIHQELLDGYRKIIKICESLLGEKHS